jgi:hypothetical protein
MENKRQLLIIVLAFLIGLALLLGVFLIVSRVLSPNDEDLPSDSPIVNNNETDVTPGEDTEPEVPVSPGVEGAQQKTFTGQGFSFSYPANWGILTCRNSNHIELDPVNPQDRIDVLCDYAVKSITIIVGTNPVCSGDSRLIGNYNVVSSSYGSKGAGEMGYRWCVESNPTLDITHRVSHTGQRGTSREDFSAEIERLISTIR